MIFWYIFSGSIKPMRSNSWWILRQLLFFITLIIFNNHPFNLFLLYLIDSFKYLSCTPYIISISDIYFITCFKLIESKINSLINTFYLFGKFWIVKFFIKIFKLIQVSIFWYNRLWDYRGEYCWIDDDGGF
jgi:hypothetical protein